ncbi:MAG: GAF domain-containing protein [Clostridiales bacterium]|nr:GAF domain-containing protein [Clostridiales bacterium]
MKEFKDIKTKDKVSFYQLLQKQVSSLLEGEDHVIAGLSNISALLYHALENVNWLGFYLVHNDELLLGPFQGKVACVHIPFGKGVCGTCYNKKETIVVEDVHQFPGHIACDSASLSEIVVPIFYQDKVIGVLDVDSPVLNRFDGQDKEGLEAIVKVLESKLDFSNFKY